MANSSYQIATTPKLYVSYPLFQYASGALDSYFTDKQSISEEDMIKLIQLDPSNYVTFNNDVYSYEKFNYRIVPSYDNNNPVDTGLWNFDFFMMLGHNMHSTTGGKHFLLRQYKNDTHLGELAYSNIVNCPYDSSPEYDGWSLAQIDETPSDANELQIHFTSTDVSSSWDNFSLGALAWGKSYTFPINTQINTSTKFEYGISQKSTISGKTISTANWTKPNNWITEPFGLNDGEEGDNFQRRSGRRVWKMTFDSLAPDKVMPQNMMMNDNGFNGQDNHSVPEDADGVADYTSSLYNINNSEDFYSAVVHKTMGGHLPMVLQIDSSDNSPSNFAIVRMNKDYTVTQKSPLLFSYSITLTEQI